MSKSCKYAFRSSSQAPFIARRVEQSPPESDYYTGCLGKDSLVIAQVSTFGHFWRFKLPGCASQGQGCPTYPASHLQIYADIWISRGPRYLVLGN